MASINIRMDDTLKQQFNHLCNDIFTLSLTGTGIHSDFLSCLKAALLFFKVSISSDSALLH